MPRYQIKVEYDGTNFVGWQYQKNGLSIRGISFNAKKESFSKYLLNYKKEINVVGYLSENFWNNKKTLQLVVRDLII